MSRYPYTYAADFIREHGPQKEVYMGSTFMVPVLSRSDAAQISHIFEKVLNMDHEQMAKKLADAFLEEYPPIEK